MADLLTVVTDRSVSTDISKAFDRFSMLIFFTNFDLISSFLGNRQLRVVLGGTSSQDQLDVASATKQFFWKKVACDV